jgi:alginate O-acetyltransferase complex protein AlgI
LNFLLFVSLFHQLVAGPIVRYSHIAHEIENRIFSWNDFNSGVSRFCRGLFKKVAIANVAGELATPLLDSDFNTLTVFGGWYGIVLYSLQIYFDFSGYSDMAIGMGRMFGFHYHENFKHPYVSKSITDFWRRWHISLSSCFRDYLYIPLGGNRNHPIRNLFIVWAFTGLWHGASWNFVLWGLYFGILLVLEKYLIGKILSRSFVFIQHLYALFFIVLGWAIFYFTDLSSLFEFSKLLFGFKHVAIWDFRIQSLFVQNAYWLIFALIACIPIYARFKSWMSARFIYRPGVIAAIDLSINLFFFLISVILLVGSTYNPFIYFRF